MTMTFHSQIFVIISEFVAKQKIAEQLKNQSWRSC